MFSYKTITLHFKQIKEHVPLYFKSKYKYFPQWQNGGNHFYTCPLAWKPYNSGIFQLECVPLVLWRRAIAVADGAEVWYESYPPKNTHPFFFFFAELYFIPWLKVNYLCPRFDVLKYTCSCWFMHDCLLIDISVSLFIGAGGAVFKQLSFDSTISSVCGLFNRISGAAGRMLQK